MGLACEPKNFHLGDVDLQEGLGSIHHIDDSRVFLDDRSEKTTFSLKVRLPTMPREEIPNTVNGSLARAAGSSSRSASMAF